MTLALDRHLRFVCSESADVGTQTKVVMTYEVESQVFVSADACSQTDPVQTPELQLADCGDLEASSAIMFASTCSCLHSDLQSNSGVVHLAVFVSLVVVSCCISEEGGEPSVCPAGQECEEQGI